MAFSVVKRLKHIGAMKTFTKLNCNLCLGGCLTIIKKLYDERVTLLNKNSEMYEACGHKTNFHRFCLISFILYFILECANPLDTGTLLTYILPPYVLVYVLHLRGELQNLIIMMRPNCTLIILNFYWPEGLAVIEMGLTYLTPHTTSSNLFFKLLLLLV